MQTNGMVSCRFKFSLVEVKMDFSKMTVGDRIEYLLKVHGRQDRQREYTQYDLCDMLTGAIEAPNGKRYAISTSRSVVNRYLNNKQEMTYEIILTICEIFHVSADWLLRGEAIDEDEKDQFMTPEAGRIARMVDSMSTENRELMKILGEGLLSADQRQNNSDVRIAELLQENIKLLSNGQRVLADEHIRRTDQNRRRLSLHHPQNQ